jgi:hypothetical protein
LVQLAALRQKSTHPNLKVGRWSEAVRAWAYDHPEFSASDVMEAFGMSRREWAELRIFAISEGIWESNGKDRRLARYSIAA